MRNAAPDIHSVESLTFQGGLSLLGVFMTFIAIFLAGWTAYVTPTLQHVFGFSSTDPWRVVLNAFPGAIMLSVGYGVLRLEGIHARDVGVSWLHARSGIVWFASIVVVLNVLLLLVAVVTGGQLSWSYTDLTPLLIVVYAFISPEYVVYLLTPPSSTSVGPSRRWQPRRKTPSPTAAGPSRSSQSGISSGWRYRQSVVDP